MKLSFKPYFYGFSIGVALMVTAAYAEQQGVSILPEQALVINRANQAIPVYAPEPVEIKTNDRNPVLIKADKPLKIEWTRASDIRWEYRTFQDADALLESTKTRSVQDALNKLGAVGWEMVSPYVLKRIKS